ncbi:hypothetical protein QCI42_10070 [Bacillus fungorum]|uniref:hypothetical protein n=1 Tax=Bacillus fungorum TaxID=2039284 RepID=UPI0033982AED
MDKENPLSQQVNNIPSDALNTPSKEQEQMLETSSQDSNNANKKDVTQGLSGTDLSFSDAARTKNKK